MSSVIFLMGPTASGKTELAVRLSKELPIDIISVDSVMVYRGLDIGSAKPSAKILATAPHRLIDICDPSESYSAAQFCDDALAEIKASFSHKRIPLLVGGTFLYFKALQNGLSPLPSADQTVRQQLALQAENIGWKAMHARLQNIDPDSAIRIHYNDPQRIQRALEVYDITGKTMSELVNCSNNKQLPYPILKIVVANKDRAQLHRNIANRFQKMLNQGLVAEVEALYSREDLHAELPAIRAVGYRQVWEYLAGDIDKQAMQEQAVIATRQFAKRQFTWLRSDAEVDWLDATSETIYEQVLKRVKAIPS